jgi:hypothetical protein
MSALARPGVGVAALLTVLGPGGARSFTISSPLTQGCHEMITSAALRSVRIDVPNAAPLPLTLNEQALVDDLQFSPDADMKDLGAATLLVSVRDNDLKGRSSDDLTELAQVHGDPNNQEEHCLRANGEVEPGGSAAAIADCRAFILGRVSQALDGLDATGFPDESQRTTLTVHLSLRGTMDAPLPTYYLRIGQAIHALQDSFTHTYRTADGMKITVVLNWLRVVDGTLVESRDGPAHTSSLDVCSDPDPLTTQRHLLATAASEALLRATLDPASTRDQKMASAGAILDTYLSYAPGCTFDNQWCAAPENQYQTSKTGCGAAGGGAGAWGCVLAALALWVLARRSRVALVAAAVFVSGVVQAETAPAPISDHAIPPPVTRAVAEPGPRDPSEVAWGAYAGIGGSVNSSAAAGTLGARLRLSRHWMVGVSGEWNPWIALNGAPFRAGVFNAYGSAILRLPLAYENFNLRTTVSLGASYLLTTLYGAGAGTIGLYGGLSPLGLEWKLSKVFFLIIEPLNLALPVPQLRGVPLAYPQYRLSIGLEVSLTDLFSGRPNPRR